MVPQSTIQIGVLGAGPAGSAAALGLRRLGYGVTCVSAPRNPKTVEGVSERVYEAMLGHGFSQACSIVSAPIRRSVFWNGEHNSANTERLVDRARFDAMLISDLQHHGVEVVEDTVQTLVQNPDGWLVSLHSGEERAFDFLVEARGRRADTLTKAQRRGPESIAIGARWSIKESIDLDPQVVVSSHRDGWSWVASLGKGAIYTQVNCDGVADSVPKHHDVISFLQTRVGENAQVADWLRSAELIGKPHFRGSTAVLNDALAGDRHIRVGDAAMAVDPLSGNGVFQSLSSALSAPSVVNTILQVPHHTELAISYYVDRVGHLFDRFSRNGRDFYALVDAQSDYWDRRRCWPDQLPAHINPDRVVGTAQKPVSNNGLIELAEVVITEDQPLGIWRVDGENAVDRLRRLGRIQ